MLSHAEQEKIVRESIRGVISNKKGVSKPLLKKFARLFSDVHRDSIHDELKEMLLRTNAASFPTNYSKLSELESITDIDYNMVMDCFLKCSDIFKFGPYHMTKILSEIDDDRFFAYWNLAEATGSIGKLASGLNYSTIRRISDIKKLGEHPVLIKVAEAFVADRKEELKHISRAEDYLPIYGSLANHSELIKTEFEDRYVFYLENKKVNSKWETKAYISALCRGLRNYKNKEFRQVLIRKLVLIKEPALQKRMAREFSKSRKYLNLA